MWYVFLFVVYVDGAVMSESGSYASQVDCMEANMAVRQVILRDDRVREFYVSDCRKIKLGPKA
jgi:hypothetical protein